MKTLRFGLILLVSVSTSLAGEWHIEEVDYSGSLGFGTSLELDANDLPFIAYYMNSQVMLARWEAGGWNIEVVEAGDFGGDSISLALDSLNLPHIAYVEHWPAVDLVYAHWTGTEWQIETVDGNGSAGPYCSIAVDSSDNPHIAYMDIEESGLKYAHWDGDEWLFELIDTDGVGTDTSLALDSNDRPHISYTNRDTAELKYTRWDGSEWLIETVDGDGPFRTFTSITLDSIGHPHIAYAYNNKGVIYQKYAHWDGAEWRIERVDGGVSSLVGGHCSIALDSTDQPYISYYNQLDAVLKCAHKEGLDWTSEVADPDSGSGRYTSIEIDSLDLPHISYEGPLPDSKGLRYAWYEVFFHLLIPEHREIVTTPTPTLDWTDDDNPDLTGYTLWWGTDPDFNDYNEVTDIGESEYTITSGIEDEDRIYWRVKSRDEDEEEYWAEEMDWNFRVELVYFHLLSPEKGESVDTRTPLLDWSDYDVPDLASYTLWWGFDPQFEDYNEVTGILESEYQIQTLLGDDDVVYWRVKAINEDLEVRWAVEMDWYFDVDIVGGIDIVDFAANSEDEGVLVNWRIEGDSPSGLRVLRTIGDEEPIFLHSEPLNGDATRFLDREVSSGVEYRYWLEVTEADGSVKRFGPTESVTVPEYIPELILYAAYPNPSREVINFVFSLPDDGRVELSVYDLSGRRLATLVSSDLAAGRHEVSWSCVDVESGVYLYRLETEAGSITQRLVVSR